RVKRPVCLVFVADVEIVFAGGVRTFVAARPRSSVFDPLRQIGDLLPRQLLVRGHLELDVLMVDRFDEQALLGMAGYDGGAGFAAGEHVAERIEAQATL